MTRLVLSVLVALSLVGVAVAGRVKPTLVVSPASPAAGSEGFTISGCGYKSKPDVTLTKEPSTTVHSDPLFSHTPDANGCISVVFTAISSSGLPAGEYTVRAFQNAPHPEAEVTFTVQ